MRSVSVFPIPAFTDNYLWLVHDTRNAFVVDPGDAEPVNQALTVLGLTLQGILVTHHHSDHVGGVLALKKEHKVTVWGPRAEHIQGITQSLSEGDTIVLEELGDLSFEIIELPGHTLGHIAYYSAKAKLLFCGDTLFSAGCGRLFEGTPHQMMGSLAKLSALPLDTTVYCTHEYTLSNLAFAKAADPVNAARDEYAAWCEAQRKLNKPTLPSTIARELLVNPFLRCDVPQVQATISTQAGKPLVNTLEVFTEMRAWKNVYRA